MSAESDLRALLAGPMLDEGEYDSIAGDIIEDSGASWLALLDAAQAREKRGHNDTCSYALDDDQHTNGHECDCGHAALAAALAALSEPRP